MNASVLCREVGVTAPKEVQWYDPHCRLVSTNPTEDVYQTNPVSGDQGRAVLLVFKSYQQSQGGKYYCRVERTLSEGSQLLVLPLIIGECVGV